MRILSLLIILIMAGTVFCQSPHEKTLKYDCSLCHQTTDWQVIPSKTEFRHDETAFQLTGQHLLADCRSCHIQLKFNGTKDQCTDCHKDIHASTVGFDCARCHTPQNWIVRDINNLHQVSRFPLTGVHLRTDCNQCHTDYANLNFNIPGINCYDCHSGEYSATKNPNHLAAGFSTECRDCHSINSETWSAENFVHDFFPLTGGHNISGCFNCHKQGGFTGLSKECYSCHQADFESTKNPDHSREGFSTDCTKCHNITAFIPSTFQHSQTAFPLTGRHINVSCKSCHISGYASIPSDCYSCHKKDYEGTNDPSHLLANLPKDCLQCHTTNGWDDGNFDHSVGGFPLTGAHVSLNCNSCHQDGYAGISQECFSCHMENFNVALNHASQNYPQDCSMCHSTVVWNQTTFNHDNTLFPLVGVHITTTCSSCHISAFAGTPIQCAACHQTAYDASVNPNPSALAITVTCQDCHTVSPGWQPASFAIHSNYYVLEGAHSVLASNCVMCHNGNYATTPNTCFGCHTDDYNNTNNPPHSSSGFSTTCTSCHTQTSWSPSTFDHSIYFPIYTGKHQGKWNLCSDCHTNPSNYSVFSCIDCHEHNQNDMNDKHSGVNGYIYQSTACLNCHPNGESDKLRIPRDDIR